MSNATSAELAVKCHACGEPIESVPTWLIGAEVRFECERCRQKHAKAVADLEAEPRRTSRKSAPPALADDSAEEIEDDEIDPESGDVAAGAPEDEVVEEDADLI